MFRDDMDLSICIHWNDKLQLHKTTTYQRKYIIYVLVKVVEV